MRRILYVVPCLGVGGAERALVRLLARLDRGRFEPVVCALTGGGPLRRDVLDLGVRLHELTVAPGLANLQALSLLPILRAERPAVVHGRLILANLWARWGRLVGAKIVTEERGQEVDRPGLITRLNRVTLTLDHAIVANSRAVADAIVARDGVSRPRVRVIYGGVDPDAFAPSLRDRDIDIVSVARLERCKGVFDLVDAVARCARGGLHLRVVLVGGGSETEAVRARVAAAGLRETVTLAGEQTDVRPYLARARLFALASHEEGLPNAVMEAMAAGLPVVATAAGGTAELVAPGETGLLVPPRAPDAFANALTDALRNDERLRSWGLAGRRRVETTFSFAATTRAYEALYDELLA